MAENKLRTLRLEKYPDMTSQAFCEMIGIKPPVYSKYECGMISNPYASNEDIVIKIANALGTTSEAIREMISNNYQLRQQGKLDLGPHSKTRRSGASIEISSSENNVLAHWRISNNLSQSEAANILEVPRATYSMWEQGYHKPVGDNLKKLIDLTGLSMHQIATIPHKVANQASKKIEEPKQEPLTFSDMPVINANWPLNFIKQVRRNNTKETYFPIKKEYPFVDQWIADKLFDFVDNPAEKDAQHHYRFNEQQATAVRLYYREFGNNLKSVGEKMGLSKSRVQQIIMKAQRKFKICIENEIIRRANTKSDAEVMEALDKKNEVTKNAYPLNFIVDRCGLPAEDWIVEEFNRQMDEKVYASKDADSYIFFKDERYAIRKVFRDGVQADGELLGNVAAAELTFKDHIKKSADLIGTVAEKITEAKNEKLAKEIATVINPIYGLTSAKIDTNKQDPMQKKLANQTVSYLKEENVLDGSDRPANNSKNITISKHTARCILRDLYGALEFNEYYKILSEFTKGGLNL